MTSALGPDKTTGLGSTVIRSSRRGPASFGPMGVPVRRGALFLRGVLWYGMFRYRPNPTDARLAELELLATIYPKMVEVHRAQIDVLQARVDQLLVRVAELEAKP